MSDRPPTIEYRTPEFPSPSISMVTRVLAGLMIVPIFFIGAAFLLLGLHSILDAMPKEGSIMLAAAAFFLFGSWRRFRAAMGWS